MKEPPIQKATIAANAVQAARLRSWDEFTPEEQEAIQETRIMLAAEMERRRNLPLLQSWFEDFMRWWNS